MRGEGPSWEMTMPCYGCSVDIHVFPPIYHQEEFQLFHTNLHDSIASTVTASYGWLAANVDTARPSSHVTVHSPSLQISKHHNSDSDIDEPVRPTLVSLDTASQTCDAHRARRISSCRPMLPPNMSSSFEKSVKGATKIKVAPPSSSRARACPAYIYLTCRLPRLTLDNSSPLQRPSTSNTSSRPLAPARLASQRSSASSSSASATRHGQ